jgi:ATP-dependent Clp protease ATP-binding subunit ClpC
MFERYTDRARRVIFFARYDASALASSSIDSEHLLLGLLREGAGIAGKIFKRNKLTYEVVRREIEARGKLQAPTSTSVDMPLSPEAKLVLQHASEEAEGMGAPHIDMEHLLLGLLRESECLAGDILASKGVHLEEVREETRPQPPAKQVAPWPKEAFPKLADFLRRLEDRKAAYHVSAFHQEAMRVEVALPEEKWVVTFFPDGRVAVEVFSASGAVEDEAALARLFDRLDPPKNS